MIRMYFGQIRPVKESNEAYFSLKKINVITRKERHVGKIEYKLFKSIFKLQKIFFKRNRYYHCSYNLFLDMKSCIKQPLL